MAKRLYVDPYSFVEISEDRSVLASEFASRDRSPDFTRYMMTLPDPDPVLRKMGKDLTVYRDLLSDAHVWATTDSRFSGLLRKEWAIEEADKSAGAAKAAEISREAFRRLNVDQIVGDALEAVLYGYAVLELIWDDIDGYWLPKAIVGKPQEWFPFDVDGKLRFKSKEHPIHGEEVPDYKFVVVQNRPRYMNPYGERVLSRCFWPVTFKRGGLKFWAMFTERYGMPFLVGKVPSSMRKADREDLKDKLIAMIQDAVAVIPDDSSVEILTDASRSSSSDLYWKLVSACNAEVSKAVVGQTLTTEIGETGGAYAASETHNEVRGDIVDRDGKLVAGAFDTILRWIAEFNVAGAPAARWKWQEEEDIRTDLAERDGKLRDQGVRFTPKYYERKYGFATDEFEIRESAPAVPVQFAERSGGRKVDELAAAAARDAAPALKGMVETVIEEARKASTFEELVERVYAIYPKLDVKQMTKILSRARFGAEALGRVEAGEEVGR